MDKKLIEDLRNASTIIVNVADKLAEMYSTDTPAVSLEQVRTVLVDKSRQDHTDEVRKLLQKYGASRLTQIDPANYKALLAEAEVL